jgi:predicted esterase
MKNIFRTHLITLPVLMGLSFVTLAQDAPVFREALYSGALGSRGTRRSAVFTDPILSRYVTGTLNSPQEGEVSGKSYRGETLHWKRIMADASGAFTNPSLRGGYLYLTCDSDSERIVILKTNGNSDIYVNGMPRAGDYYAKGWIILPIQLKKGENVFWLKPGRGRKKSIALTAPPKPVFLTDVDMTVPDFLTHEINDKQAAIRVVNATNDTLDNLIIRSNVAGAVRTTTLRGTVTPMAVRKIPYTLRDGAYAVGKQAVQVSLYRGETLLDEIAFTIEVKEPAKQYRRTFISEIDGSLQYYGVRQGQAESGKKPALFLSVHGAGVKGIGQAAAYQPKDWGHVIAPTNRREFGFDWEDWGRIDAMEALADAEARYGTDPVRTYLTGHSMGGHGAWYLGATYPARWAAIAPMAGWRSFFSYVGTEEFTDSTPMEAMLNRAANPSRTMEMARNYLQHGVFIEHGDNDRTVPVREARAMREYLGAIHPDLAYYEEPGGGHWYGVDHQRVFDYFKWHEKKDVRDVDVLEFRSVSPGVSHASRYITLYQQKKSYAFCGVVAKQTIRSRSERRSDTDISARKIEVATENLAAFKIDLGHCQHLQSLAVEVDGQAIDLSWPGQDELWLKHQGDTWAVMDKAPGPEEKSPKRYGGFKDAFRHRMVFVYATGGRPAENAWSYGKARFDAETFYYRGNGAMDVIADHAFTPDAYPDRSVILYGNASTNCAWKPLLSDCPVQVTRHRMEVGGRVLSGDTWGIYMVRPRPDSEVASVGVVAGTGLPGMRAVTPNRYFVAGTGFPDLMIVSPDMYTQGVEGVKAAGYFGNDWTIEDGDIVWSKE